MLTELSLRITTLSYRRHKVDAALCLKFWAEGYGPMRMYHWQDIPRKTRTRTCELLDNAIETHFKSGDLYAKRTE